jgi:hypothetical protein
MIRRIVMTDETRNENQEDLPLDRKLFSVLASDSDRLVTKALGRLTLGILALLGLSITAHIFLFQNMTNGVKGQLALVKENVDSYREELGELEVKFDAVAKQVDRIDASTSAMQSILVQLDEDQIPLPELSNRFLEIEPIGGSGAQVVPGFVPMDNELPTSISVEQLETAKAALGDQYRSILVTQSAPVFDPQRHEVEVVHKLFRSAPSGEVRIWIVAYVVKRE